MNMDDIIKDLDGKNIDEINRQMQERVNAFNKKGIDDFEGLSPTEMTLLLSNPFYENSVINIKPFDIDTVKNLKIINDCLTILKLLQNAGRVKSDKNSPVNMDMEFVYICLDNGIKDSYKKENVKPHEATEHDFHYIFNLIDKLFAAEYIVKILNGYKAGKKADFLIKNNTLVQLYLDLLHRFVAKLITTKNDILNNAIGYTVYLLAKYGNISRPLDFYYKLYEKAWPVLIDEEERNSQIEKYFFIQFHSTLRYLDIVEMKAVNNSTKPKDLQIKKSSLFDKIFGIKK